MTSEITELLHSTKPGTDRSISLQTRLPGRFGVSLRYSSQTAAIKSLRFDLTNCTIRQALQYSGTLRGRLLAVSMHLPKLPGAVEVKTTYVTLVVLRINPWGNHHHTGHVPRALDSACQASTWTHE